MRPALYLAMVAVAAFVGCTTVLGLDDLEYRDLPDAGPPDAGPPDAGPPDAGSVIWSRRIGGQGDDRASGVATDPSGDVVVSGCMGGVDAGVPGCIAQSESDVFASRYSSEGEPRWSNTFGDDGDQFAESLAGGPSGTVIAGFFEGSFGFGGPLLVNTAANTDDLFFAKLGPTGSHLWSARYGTAGDERAVRVATDTDENVILTGVFGTMLNFGGDPLIGPQFQVNPFLAKFDTFGGLLWRQTFPATGDVVPSSVAFDAAGNVLVTGLFSYSVDFGTGTLNGPAGDKNAFVATFLANGDPRWAVPLSGAGYESGVAVDADSNGDVVVVGLFDGTVDLGNESFTYTSLGSQDIFVGKYSEFTGAPLWATTFGGPGDDRPHDVLVDAAGNIVIVGEFVETVDFQGTTLTSVGGKDVFLVTMEPDGDVLWAQRFGDIADDIGYRLALGPSGEVFMAGSFAGTIRFGDEYLESTGGSDAFLVKFAP